MLLSSICIGERSALRRTQEQLPDRLGQLERSLKGKFSTTWSLSLLQQSSWSSASTAALGHFGWGRAAVSLVSWQFYLFCFCSKSKEATHGGPFLLITKFQKGDREYLWYPIYKPIQGNLCCDLHTLTQAQLTVLGVDACARHWAKHFLWPVSLMSHLESKNY